MNRHFEDSQYHLSRAAHHVLAGVRDELRPHEDRVRARIGRERHLPTRSERVQARIERARHDARRYTGRLHARAE